MEAAGVDLSVHYLLTRQHLQSPGKWSLGFSSLFISRSSSPSNQGSLSPTCRTPGLRHPVYALTCSLSRVRVHPCGLSFPLRHLPGAQIWIQCFFSPILPSYLGIFLGLGCIGVLLPVSSTFSVGIVIHVDVFLMCLCWEVSPMSPYSTISIPLLVC